MSDVGCRMFNPLGFSPIPRYPVLRQMAVESKPLFHPEVLLQQVRSFTGALRHQPPVRLDHRHLPIACLYVKVGPRDVRLGPEQGKENKRQQDDGPKK